MTRDEFFTIIKKLQACPAGVESARQAPGRVSVVALEWANARRYSRQSEFFDWLRRHSMYDQGCMIDQFGLTPDEIGAIRHLVQTTARKSNKPGYYGVRGGYNEM